MDFIKTKKRTPNVVTVYFTDGCLEDLSYLKELNVNISMVCREAVKTLANKMKNPDGITPDQDDTVTIKCNGQIKVYGLIKP